MSSLRVGVVGAGYFGSRHAQNYAAIGAAQLVAVCDHHDGRAAEVAAGTGAMPYRDHRDLIGAVDAVSIAVPTAYHHPVARDFLEAGISVLVEKPITSTVAEADDLIELAERRGAVLQVGHLERFNPAMLGLGSVLDRPRFIEARRVAPYRDRGTDVSVVLDLMIHDIDLVLDIIKAPVEQIDAVGVTVFSEADDFANAHIRFADGCVATITASRVAAQTERAMRVIQHDASILVDLHGNRLVVTRNAEENGGPGGSDTQAVTRLNHEEREFEGGGNLERQLVSFLEAVASGGKPLVSGVDGRRALDAALTIGHQLRQWHRATAPA